MNLEYNQTIKPEPVMTVTIIPKKKIYIINDEKLNTMNELLEKIILSGNPERKNFP